MHMKLIADLEYFNCTSIKAPDVRKAGVSLPKSRSRSKFVFENLQPGIETSRNPLAILFESSHTSRISSHYSQ
jgi:hypothetical protein